MKDHHNKYVIPSYQASLSFEIARTMHKVNKRTDLDMLVCLLISGKITGNNLSIVDLENIFQMQVDKNVFKKKEKELLELFYYSIYDIQHSHEYINNFMWEDTCKKEKAFEMIRNFDMLDSPEEISSNIISDLL